jgi:O-antigen/teichoic acid export membrane protein
VVLSDFLTVLYLLVKTRRAGGQGSDEPQPMDNRGLVRDLWRYGRWNYLLMFSNFLVEELPLIMLKSLGALNAVVGLFTTARTVGRQTRMVVTPVSQVLFPFTAASEQEEATGRTNALCRNFLLLMGLGVLIVVPFVEYLIVLLYGEEFRASARIFYALAPGIVLWPLGHFLGVHVAAAGKPRVVFFASLVALVVAATTCAVLIPRYGAFGSAMSASVIYAAQTGLRFVVYAWATGARLSEVFLPRRSDWRHYVNITKMLRVNLAARMGTKP